jgi:hypothetical protein
MGPRWVHKTKTECRSTVDRNLISASVCQPAAENGDNSGAQKRGNVCYCKQLPSNSSENATVDSAVCASVSRKVQLRAILKRPKNPITNRNLASSHMPLKL